MRLRCRHAGLKTDNPLAPGAWQIVQPGADMPFNCCSEESRVAVWGNTRSARPTIPIPRAVPAALAVSASRPHIRAPIAKIALRDPPTAGPRRPRSVRRIAGREMPFLDALVRNRTLRRRGKAKCFYELGRVLGAGARKAWTKHGPNHDRLTTARRSSRFRCSRVSPTDCAAAPQSTGLLKHEARDSADVDPACRRRPYVRSCRCDRTAADAEQPVERRRVCVLAASFLRFPRRAKHCSAWSIWRRSHESASAPVRSLIGMTTTSRGGALAASVSAAIRRGAASSAASP